MPDLSDTQELDPDAVRQAQEDMIGLQAELSAALEILCGTGFWVKRLNNGAWIASCKFGSMIAEPAIPIAELRERWTKEATDRGWA